MNCNLVKEVFVVWPPVWNAFDPHIAIPALCGYLSGRGVPLRQFDLNIEFFRHFVAEKTLERQLSRGSAPLPPHVQSAATFVRRYFEVLRQPCQPGYRQRFSEDAEQQLLDQALAIFNHFHPQTTFSTLGVYHARNADCSDFIGEFAQRDTDNPFAAFYHDEFLGTVADALPSIVGISVCGSFQLGAALTLARMIKEIEPRICVVIGGAFFSTLPEVLLAPPAARHLFRYVDAYVLNEGELPFLRLIHDVIGGRPPQAGTNVVLRGQQDLSYDARLCLPPAEIAMPQFPEGAIERYFRPVRRIPVEVSRGCYWAKCTFCNLARGSNERYRGLPVEHIVRSVETLTAKHAAPSVLFSTLAMAPKILRALASRLGKSGGQVAWSAWIRAENTLTREDFIACRQAGCASLSLTPESFNDRILSAMKKGVSAAHLIRIIRDLSDVGLCGAINLIPGFPGETEEDFLATVGVCRDLRLRGEFFPFCLLKNSPIYRDPDRFGVALHEQPDSDLAINVPFSSVSDPQTRGGIALIKMAARHYPQNIFSDDPSAGYTFDFSMQSSQQATAASQLRAVSRKQSRPHPFPQRPCATSPRNRPRPL